MNQSDKIVVINCGSTSVKFEVFSLINEDNSFHSSSERVSLPSKSISLPVISERINLEKQISGGVELKSESDSSTSFVSFSALSGSKNEREREKNEGKPVQVQFDDPDIQDTSDAFDYVFKILTSSSIFDILPFNEKSQESYTHVDDFGLFPFVKHPSSVKIVGHRVVHGGDHFSRAAIINKNIEDTIEKLCELAPLHNPPNLSGIRAAKRVFSDACHVAVFDTAFHQSIPSHAREYPLPRTRICKPLKIRRYGFHGTSHRYMAMATAQHLGKDMGEMRLVTIHLGNGASMAAIRNGECIDTSMGFTPLEGLMMGTRSGSIDPAVGTYLLQHGNINIQGGNNTNDDNNDKPWSAKDVDYMLNHESGLKGVCGTNDMRIIIDKMNGDNGDDFDGEHNPYRLAFDMYCYRIKKYLGSYLTILGGADAIVFSAGIGENVPSVREEVCDDKSMTSLFGITLDKDCNRNCVGNDSPVVISTQEEKPGTTKVVVVPTDEEKAIAEECIFEVKKKCDEK